MVTAWPASVVTSPSSNFNRQALLMFNALFVKFSTTTVTMIHRSGNSQSSLGLAKMTFVHCSMKSREFVAGDGFFAGAAFDDRGLVVGVAHAGGGQFGQRRFQGGPEFRGDQAADRRHPVGLLTAQGEAACAGPIGLPGQEVAVGFEAVSVDAGVFGELVGAIPGGNDVGGTISALVPPDIPRTLGTATDKPGRMPCSTALFAHSEAKSALLRTVPVMRIHEVRARRSADDFPRSEHLAWKIAEVATDPVAVPADTEAMVINRIIDNAAVSAAAALRRPVAVARAQALAHPVVTGAKVFGVEGDYSPEWAAWANGAAVRELDYHDTFLAAEYAHPGDNIPPLLAVAQHLELSGADLIRGLATAYEIQIDLSKGICLHEHKIDHVAHLGPSVAAGLGTMLRLDMATIYQAIGQALHLTTATRQSRKGLISSWKAFAPAWAGKVGIEAVDRAMRGEGAPAPIWEGEDGVIAWLLSGPEHTYQVPLPESGEPKRAILDSYTKEHSAEYQSQALIDLARRLRTRIADLDRIATIVLHTSHHTHYVIGTGSNDPQKMDPDASRETLDHSVMYIFAVALQDGTWHHERSYAPERAHRPDTVELWHKISTREDPEWTRRYHSSEPADRAFGARAEITLRSGEVIVDELAVADAHPLGARPFGRKEYAAKFTGLAEGVVDETAQRRFLTAVQALPDLPAGALGALNVVLKPSVLEQGPTIPAGVFG